ncbi:MAG: hypothetical protein GX306_01550 [Clostridiales bacterium]|nr:hypothetical protein [Clostridiales bacterium]
MSLGKQKIAFSLIILIIINLFGVNNNHIIKSKAASFDEINHPSVFLKQVNGDKQCTLVAATMLVRRAAMLSGNLNWADITIDQIKEQAWIDGVGIKYTFTYEGITVNKACFEDDPVSEAITLLQEHPEGIVIYDQNRIPRSHAILLTDYTKEMFYCADPSDAVPYGRIPINEGLVQIEDAEFYYYVSSPSIPSPTPSSYDDNIILPEVDISAYEAELSQTAYIFDENEKRPIVTIPGLVENVDYYVSYFNNLYPGSAFVIITGTGSYSGNIIKSFEIMEASDYIEDISVAVTKNTIKKGKTATIKVTLPEILILVKEFDGNEQDNLNEVKINYSSSNSKVAKVNSKGKITGKKKGTTKINVTVSLADGTEKAFTFTIKVK